MTKAEIRWGRIMIKLLIWKLLKTIGAIALTFGCVIVAIYLTGEKGYKTATTIGGFLILTELVAIWRPKKTIGENGDKKSKFVINCPQCGRSLKGATQEMIGDTGVCPKCKAEFIIEQSA